MKRIHGNDMSSDNSDAQVLIDLKSKSDSVQALLHDHRAPKVEPIDADEAARDAFTIPEADAAFERQFGMTRFAFDEQQKQLERQSEIRLGGNGQSPSSQDEFKKRAAIICMADVEAEDVTWLWPNRIAFGKMTLIAGDPGLGKSFLSLDIAARLSRGGDWPDARGTKMEPGNVLLVSAEDDKADTIRPRLDKAGADVSRIFLLDGIFKTADGEKFYPSLDSDLRAIEDRIVEESIRLVIVDPISAYLGDRDSHRNAEIRGLLGPIADMAARTGCAVLTITHMNKSANANALYRAIGSIAFAAAARSAWAIAKDKDDDTLRLMLPVKSNLVAEPSGIGFRIVDGAVGWSDEPVTISANAALDTSGESDGSKLSKAVEFLENLLITGPMPSKAIETAGRAHGHSYRTLVRAKDKLGLKVTKGGGADNKQWTWEISEARYDQ